LSSEIAHVERGGVPLFSQEAEPPTFDFGDGPPVDYGCAPDEKPSDDLIRIERAMWLEEVRRALDPCDAVWSDRVARDDTPPTPADRTVGGLVKVYLALREAKVVARNISAKGHDNAVDCLNHFRDWVGVEAAATVIDARRWEAYYLYLTGKVGDRVWSRDYAGKVFRTARKFVEWLTKMDLIPLPKNLHDREYRFGKTAKAVPTMSVEEVRSLVLKATGQLRLHLLLMANCGMTQRDISDLRQDEVDWEGGRIIRKRSKTGDHASVPTVSYPLWPQTRALLRQYRAGAGELALLTLSGRRWVEDRWVDGKLVRTDSIASNYAHLKKKVGFDKPLKLLRKTSVSMLDNHETFARFFGHFLGHAPRSIQERHYVARSQERFDAAVVWLGEQYGFVDCEEQSPAV
jgi:integrase